MLEIPVQGLPHEDAYNPAMIRWQDRTLMMYRVGNCGDGESFIGELDEKFQPVGTFSKVVIPGQLDCEDPRFFLYRHQLYFSFVTFKKNKRTVIGFGRVNDDLSVQDVRIIENTNSTTWEKNWIFFQHGEDDLYLTYAMSEGIHQVCLLTHEGIKPVHRTRYSNHWVWGRARGGTQLVPHKGLWHGFFHGTQHITGSNESRYFMGAYAVSPEPPFPIIKMSRCPLYIPQEDRFHGPSILGHGHKVSVIFPSGLMFHDEHWFVAAGYNDHRIKIFKISEEELNSNLISTVPKEGGVEIARARDSKFMQNYAMLLHFPIHDPLWMKTLEMARNNISPGQTVFAHDMFLHCFPGAQPYTRITEESLRNGVVWLILHKGFAESIDLKILKYLKQHFTAVFANEVFILFTNTSWPGPKPAFDPNHILSLWVALEKREGQCL